ncbi:MAG: hypothetical protein HWD59_01805 [Coxiellaceae bacterium]|nr:MAG: hypothetical protein HWD59_01805 [Coxiellaceae bacterium]
MLEDLFETEEQFANHFQINAFVKLERTFKDLELEIFDDTDGSGPVVELENSELGYSPKRLQEVLDRLDNGKLYLGKNSAV